MVKHFIQRKKMRTKDIVSNKTDFQVQTDNDRRTVVSIKSLITCSTKTK